MPPPPRGRRRNPKLDKKRKHARPPVQMLNVKRERSFKFDVREVFEKSNVDPEAAKGILASMIAMGSKQSLAIAKDFVRKKAEEGVIDQDVEKQLLRLLDVYSRRR